MTNADKYLKDGVDKVRLYAELTSLQPNYCYNDFEKFFNKETKPTPTEDEKVILKKALESGADAIIRNDFGIYFHTKPGTTGIFSNLFQFIQPRRRI